MQFMHGDDDIAGKRLFNGRVSTLAACPKHRPESLKVNVFG